MFNFGDKVMRCVHDLSEASKKFNAKLAPKCEGPFTILKANSPIILVIGSQKRGNWRLSLIYVFKLMRYVRP